MTPFDVERWRRLSPLLDEVLDLTPPERVLRLESLTAEDAALAADLGVLLDAHAQADHEGFLDGVAETRIGAAAMPPPTLEGRRLGAYTLIRLLGQGGTGSAWRARRDDGRFEGEVAIKLLHLSLLGRVQAERFRREGAILARLSHPNIARLLDAGVSDGGQPFLVLELVDGERIDRHCDTHRLTIDERLVLFDDVLAAVDHAHRHLVIHRDIKPTNILVGTESRVKLLDFGIAKFIEDQSTEADSTITVEGGHSFTPEYAAPEQWRGEAPTTATDVYALGVLLYQLFTGRHPTAPARANAQQVMRTTLEVEPVRLGAAFESEAALAQAAADRGTTPARLLRQLRGDLEHIVARALRKEPGQRYATVSALAEDLRRLRAHEPVSARAGALAYRAAKFLRRHRFGVSAGALAGVVAVAGLAGTLWQAQQAAHERDRAVRQFAQAEAVEEFMTFLLAGSANRPFTTAELLDRGAAVADVQFADDPAAAARLQFAISGIYSELDAQDKTGEMLAKALASAQRADDIDLEAQIECAAAAEAGLETDNVRAATRFEHALARLGPPEDGEHRESLAYCHHTRGMRAFEMGDAKLSISDERAALELLGKPRPGTRSLQISMRQQLAGSMAKDGDIAGAVVQMESAIAELQAMGRIRTITAQTLFNNLGVIYNRGGQPLHALGAFDRALQVNGELPEGDESTPALSANLANVLVDLGRVSEGQRALDHALATAAQRGDTRSPPFAVAQFAWCAEGELARCDQRLETAREQMKALLPPGHHSLAVPDVSYARMALAQGHPELAKPRLDQALAMFGPAEPGDPYRVRALALLARTELKLGDVSAAERDAWHALAAARSLSAGFDHSTWMGAALVALGEVQRARHDPAAADTLQKATIEFDAAAGDDASVTREARSLLAAR
jgi:serine/threonine-protein kinase